MILKYEHFMLFDELFYNYYDGGLVGGGGFVGWGGGVGPGGGNGEKCGNDGGL